MIHSLLFYWQRAREDKAAAREREAVIRQAGYRAGPVVYQERRRKRRFGSTIRAGYVPGRGV